MVADPLQTPFVACEPAGEEKAGYKAMLAYGKAVDEVHEKVTVVTIQEWDGSDWGDECDGSSTLPLQRIEIRAPSPDGTRTVTMEVVKRGDAP